MNHGKIPRKMTIALAIAIILLGLAATVGFAQSISKIISLNSPVSFPVDI